MRPHGEFLNGYAPGQEFIVAGQVIANAVRKERRQGRQGTVLTDLDGVVFDGREFTRPHPTPLTGDTMSAYATLESAGVPVGLATARGTSAIEWLTEAEGLTLAGPKILSGGEHIIIDDTERHLGPPGFSQLISQVSAELPWTSFYVPDWQSAQMFQTNLDGSVNVTFGNQQWSSDTTLSLWYPDQGKENARVLDRQIRPFVCDVARAQGFDTERDVSIRGTHMPRNGVMMISIKAARDGQPITKAHASHLLESPIVFIADGPGDAAMARNVKRDGGEVIGIGGSPDSSDDIQTFLAIADAVLPGPEDLPQALEYATFLLTSNGRRMFT